MTMITGIIAVMTTIITMTIMVTLTSMIDAGPAHWPCGLLGLLPVARAFASERARGATR